MPVTITIASFTFGAILVLIALLGGGFKLFGAEIVGTTGSVGRGLAGILGFALLALGLYSTIRSDGLASSSTDAEPPVRATETSGPPFESQNPHASDGAVARRNENPAPGTSITPIASQPADPDHDSITVLSMSPKTNVLLSSRGNFSVSLMVHYRLVSSDTLLFVPSLEQYGPGDPCRSGNHRTIGSNDPSQIPIRRGEGNLSIVLTVPADVHTDLGNFGYVSARGSFWSGFDAQGRVITNTEEVRDPTKFCFRYGPV